MIINFSRSGGFTGIPIKKTIDTEKLPAETAKKIEELIASPPLCSAKQNFAGQADRFTYTISIDDDAISKSVTIDERSLDPQMQELLQLLQNDF